MTVPRPEHWSHSTLQLYRECPAAYAAKVRGEPGCAPPNVHSGAELHEAIARYARHCWEQRRKLDKEAAQTIAEGYPGGVSANLLAFAESARFPWTKAKGPLEQECPVEQLWEATLTNGERFVGRIDLALLEVGGAEMDPFADNPDLLKIIDWKQRRPQEWWADEAPVQLLSYALLHHKAHEPQTEYQVMLGGPGWQTKWAFKAWKVSVSQIAAVERRLCGEIERVIADETCEPCPGPETCPRCFFVAACPLRDTMTMQVLTESSTAELATACGWHSAQESLAKKILKSLAGGNGGTVWAGLEEWGWTPKTSLRPIDEAALDEVCAAASTDRTELLGGYDKRKIAKAIKAGWLPEGLFEEYVSGRSFGPLKPQGENETDTDATH